LRILSLSKAFTHTLLEWPVFSVDLRMMKFRVMGEDYADDVYDGIIRDDPSLLLLPIPLELEVSDSMDCCFVKREVSVMSS
jgi:hypothetical protein